MTKKTIDNKNGNKIASHSLRQVNNLVVALSLLCVILQIIISEADVMTITFSTVAILFIILFYEAIKLACDVADKYLNEK